jgi:hydroxymethylpyrimidine pyrophosphatase-like HAD family hydrolase/hypoxanthine phosphoribosyltransferase
LILADRYMRVYSKKDRKSLVVGIRTAGAYFAPLFTRYMELSGWESVEYITVRPKNGLSSWEKKRLLKSLKMNERILIVDDHPNSGNTLSLILKILMKTGFRSDQITILAPLHPAQKNWLESVGSVYSSKIEIISIAPSDYYKQRLLDPSSIKLIFQEYLGPESKLQASPILDRINDTLLSQYPDGFQVRMKQVYEIIGSANQKLPGVKYVLAKSVGWGWMGYHAYLAALRLQGFVPELFGLRNGFLFSEWEQEGNHDQSNISYSDVKKFLPSYLSTRTRRLQLNNPPYFERTEYKWTGWDDLVFILGSVYGSSTIRRLKTSIIEKQLKKWLIFGPILIDGKISPEEFIQTKNGLLKVDFEHHNFGGAELDISDPALDLASAIFEFRLSDRAERELIASYREESGDDSISDRIIFYKILYGSRVIQTSAYKLNATEAPAHDKWNKRYLWARNFLTFLINGKCAELIPFTRTLNWTEKLFFLDLDGVFDRESFGPPEIPHSTESGMKALFLLRKGNYSIVLNTGRNIQHIKYYCKTFAFAGGVGEFGSVFWDEVAQKEVALIDKETNEMLNRCREALRNTPGIYVDDDYRYSVRAFRFKGLQTKGLQPGEIQKVIKDNGLDRINFFSRQADTYFVQAGRDKGYGVNFVNRYLMNPPEFVSAMGDSHFDLGMLRAANVSFAPSNCSPKLLELSKEGKCRIMSGSYQKGLLQAAVELTKELSLRDDDKAIRYQPNEMRPKLINDLLCVTERSRFRKILSIFSNSV